MRRLALALALWASLAVAPAAGATTLPSHEEPNAPGSISIPLPLSTAPSVPERRGYPELLALWQRAGSAYGVPWEILAAINKIESDFGRNMGPSSAGAVGWMQFMPDTWMRWGLDADGDGIANPWDPEDGVFAAARYLAAAGARDDLSRAIFAYNHADWYVRDVLELAQAFAGADGGFVADLALPPAVVQPTVGAPLVFEIDDTEQRLAGARRRVTRAKRALVRAEKRYERFDWWILDAQQRAGDPDLTDAEFLALEAEVTRLTVARDGRAAAIEERRAALEYAVAALDELRKQATVQVSAVTFTRPAPAAPALPAALGGAAASGAYAFPVGGGPDIVSVARDHHDYPAADIAAPQGSPAYAFAEAVVVDVYPSPSGRCGIGLSLRIADGRTYLYCHLAYLEPELRPGTVVDAGAPVGLVGSTGNSTGPHLHLQLIPATAYPQAESWFQGFAGRAFRWQDGGQRAAAAAPSGGAGAAVFDVVAEPVSGDVVTFTR